MGYLENEVLVYFVEDMEVKTVISKIKKFLGDDVKHEYNQSKMGLKVIFRDREKAEWCMKLFSGNFVVNGKKLTFKWIKDKPRPKRNIKGEIMEDAEQSNEEGRENEIVVKREDKKEQKQIKKRNFEEAMIPNAEEIKKA